MVRSSYQLDGQPVQILERPFCERCSEKLTNDIYTHCHSCHTAKRDFHFSFLRAVGRYRKVDHQDILSAYIRKKYDTSLSFKERCQIANSLANLLHDFVKDNPEIIQDIACIFPVPKMREEERERGYNQIRMVAEKFAVMRGIDCGSENLLKIRKTEKQTHLTAEERAKNVRDAYVLLHPDRIQDKRVLLLDDVATTCATVNESARVLKDAGAKEVRVLVITRNTNPIGEPEDE